MEEKLNGIKQKRATISIKYEMKFDLLILEYCDVADKERNRIYYEQQHILGRYILYL